MALENEVASVLLRARLLEKAIHGNETWELHYSGQRQPTTPQIQERGVLFQAEFKPIEGEITVALICNGALVLCTDIFPVVPGFLDEKIEVSWTLGLGVLCPA